MMDLYASRSGNCNQGVIDMIPKGIRLFAHACCAIWPVDSRCDDDSESLYIRGISQPVFPNNELIVEHNSGMVAQANRFANMLKSKGYQVVDVVEIKSCDIGYH